jgi:hypothetical protein
LVDDHVRVHKYYADPAVFKDIESMGGRDRTAALG